jgi:pimeloyl-ACP methyl ester carboxylesterase
MKRKSLFRYTASMDDSKPASQASEITGKTGPVSWDYKKSGSETSKDSAPIVLLHGAMGSKRNWGRVVKHLSESYDVLTLDQRGHGSSDHPQIENGKGYELEDFANDLKRVINELSINKIHLLGHSMGGRVAAVFANHYPENIKSLILEDTSAEISESASGWIKETLEKTPTPFKDRKEARQWLIENIENKQIAEFFYTNIKEGKNGADWIFDKEGLFLILNSMKENSLIPLFKNFNFPVLVLRGENSTHFTRKGFETIKESFPNFTYVTITNSAHWIHADQFGSFIEAVSKFLKKGIPS